MTRMGQIFDVQLSN